MKKEICMVIAILLLLIGIPASGVAGAIPMDQDFGIIGKEWTLLNFAAEDVAYSYEATLTDYGLPTPFQALSFYILSSGTTLASGDAISGPITVDFTVDAERAFTVAILGDTNDATEAGLFNFKLSGSPVPVPASLLLLSSGLLALTALNRKKK